jgi:DNA-binding NarL/FixJ family response regulator
LAGADGFVVWDAHDTALWDTLCTVQQGGLGLPGDLALRVVRHLRQQLRAPAPRASDASAKLTLREQEIFDLVRRGMRSRDIAQRLTITKGTVDKHVQNILDKLNVHSRTQALFLAGDEPPARSALRNVQ